MPETPFDDDQETQGNGKLLDKQYRIAQQMQVDQLVDEAFEIADNINEDPASRRIRCDVRKWYAGKVSPRIYGDKLTTEHTGPDGGEQVTRIVYEWATPRDDANA